MFASFEVRRLRGAVGAATISALIGGAPRAAHAQTSTGSSIQATTEFNLPFGATQSKDSGVVPGDGGNVALASDSFQNRRIYLGPILDGTISGDARSTVSAGTIKLYSQLSAAGMAGGMSLGSTVTGISNDGILITEAPAQGGSIAVSDLIDPYNLLGNIGGSTGHGATWYGDIDVDATIHTQGASTSTDSQVRDFFYSGAATGRGKSSTGPATIPVHVGDFLTVVVVEISHANVNADMGGTADVTADFGHTTHLYIRSVTPGLKFTSDSGHDYSPLAGDANVDGTVNFADLLTLAQNYGQTNAIWDQGDFNGDGAVNFDDLLLLAQHYGQTSASAEPAPLAQVPEPIFIAIIGMATTLRRRTTGTKLQRLCANGLLA